MEMSRLVTGRDDTAEDEITRRLVAFNQTHAPANNGAPEPEPLHIFAYDAANHLIGGLTGRTNAIPRWLEISILWVDEEARRHGLGARLVAWAEREAAERNCQFARLATSDYQAPTFYARLGYTLYGTLDDCPPGETVYYYRKPLQAVSTADGHERSRLTIPMRQP